MTQIHTSRQSDSILVDRVWSTVNTGDGIYLATPDCSWDLILTTDENGVHSGIIAGQATKPSYIPYKKGSSSVVISFTAGAYLTYLPGKELVDSVIPLEMSDNDHFKISDTIIEVPTFENAEQAVRELEDAKLIAIDDVVSSILNGNYKALSDRVIQRHFTDVTGMTRKQLEQIRRAQQAVAMLQNGTMPKNAAQDAGYSDQPHLNNSLKRIMDVTPRHASNVHKL